MRFKEVQNKGEIMKIKEIYESLLNEKFVN